MIEALLERLGLEPLEIKTYIGLLEFGPSSAGVLARQTGAVRVTQYLLLKRLIEKGLVKQSLRGGIKLFSAESPEIINRVFEERIETLQKDQRIYQKLLPELNKKQREKLLVPKFQIFEGIEGVKNVLKDMLLYRDIETQAYWPIKKMIEVLSPEFFRMHNKERIKRNLYTRAIWPKNQSVDLKSHPYLGVGEKFKREIRIAPPTINFAMGYWIYGNKIAFLSSRKEQYGYIIESAELREMLLSQFEMIWNQSNTLKAEAKYTDTFFQEL